MHRGSICACVYICMRGCAHLLICVSGARHAQMTRVCVYLHACGEGDREEAGLRVQELQNIQLLQGLVGTSARLTCSADPGCDVSKWASVPGKGGRCVQDSGVSVVQVYLGVQVHVRGSAMSGGSGAFRIQVYTRVQVYARILLYPKTWAYLGIQVNPGIQVYLGFRSIQVQVYLGSRCALVPEVPVSLGSWSHCLFGPYGYPVSQLLVYPT